MAFQISSDGCLNHVSPSGNIRPIDSPRPRRRLPVVLKVTGVGAAASGAVEKGAAHEGTGGNRRRRRHARSASRVQK